MKYTNKFNLPKPIVNALKNNAYDLADAPDNIISVTTLIGSPKIKILEKRHYDDIIVDVSDLIWQMNGTAMHYVAETSQGNDEMLVEERWFYCIEEDKTYTVGPKDKFWETKKYNPEYQYVSGKFDVYDCDSKTLWDYKNTSVWSFYPDNRLKDDYIEQLNINSFALRTLGFEVEQQGIIFNFQKDYKKRDKCKQGYPQSPLLPVLTETIWDDSKVLSFIKTKLMVLNAAKQFVNDDEIPPCLREDRWAKDDVWAVMKEGRKSAVKLYDFEPTKEILDSYGKNHYIEYRKGEDTRCLEYCNVCQWCNYYRDVYAGKENIL